MDEATYISEADRFASLLSRKAFYMPLPETQRPPHCADGTHRVPYKVLLALNFPISNWTVSEATFGAAKPGEFARDNVSLFLLVLQWAMSSKINVYIETLYDQVLADAGVLQEQGKRLFLPVPETKYAEFAMVVMNALHPPDEGGGGASRKRKRAKSITKPDRDQEVFDTYVSHKLINSEAKFLQVVNRMWMCQTSEQANVINFDMLETGGEADDVGFANEGEEDIADEKEVFWMLDHTRVFESDQSRSWYDEARLPHWQRTATFYTDQETKTFLVRPSIYDQFDCTMRIIRPTDGFLQGDADRLREFMQQTVVPPMCLIRDKLCELSKAAGFRKRDEYSRLNDRATRDLFKRGQAGGAKPFLTDFSHCARIQAPDPFAEAEGLSFNERAKLKLTPICAKMQADFKRRRKQIQKRIETGALDTGELDRINDDIAESVYDILDNECSGVPTMYNKVWDERKTLRRKMFPANDEDDTDVARMARAMFFFDNVSNDDPVLATMAFEDRLYCSYADTMSTHLNATPFQARIILKCKTYCAVLLRNFFGPQNGVCMQGTCDVGKSHCAQTLTTMFPASQIQSENDASDKAYVKNDISMTIVWRDEMNFGAEKQGNKDRDDKTTRSAFSTGLLIYNQYQVGRKKGDSDITKRIVIDMRSFCIATINNQLNAALRSRFDMEETFQEAKMSSSVKKGARGRSKNEKATHSPESYGKMAANLMFQFSHTGLVKYWAAESLGAFADICMRNFEIFCAISNEIITKGGQAELMARDIDKLRNLSIGAMVTRVTETWERSVQYADVVDNFNAFTRYFQIHAGALKFKDILVAKNMAKPTNADTVMDRMIIKVMKKNVEMSKGAEYCAIEDKDNNYYVTTLQRGSVAKDLTDSALSMGFDCSVDMMGRALAKLAESSILQSKCIKYEANAEKQSVLLIKKELVNTTKVMTDSEMLILNWIRAVVSDDTPNTMTWGEEFSEKHVLLNRHLCRGLFEAPVLSNTPCDAAMKMLTDRIDSTQRHTAMFWIKNMKTLGGDSVIDVQEDVTAPFSRIRQIQTTPDIGLLSVPCLPDGKYPGMHKVPMIMPGALRVNSEALATFDDDVNQQMTDLELKFADAVMAISGEAAPGQTIFYRLSDKVDANTPAAVTHTIRPWDEEVVVPNPRRREKSSVLNHAKLIDHDDILDESKATLTFSRHSRLWKRVHERACIENCGMGVEEAMAKFKQDFLRPHDDDDGDGASDVDRADAYAQDPHQHHAHC